MKNKDIDIAEITNLCIEVACKLAYVAFGLIEAKAEINHMVQNAFENIDKEKFND